MIILEAEVGNGRDVCQLRPLLLLPLNVKDDGGDLTETCAEIALSLSLSVSGSLFICFGLY